jgi:AAA domain
VEAPVLVEELLQAYHIALTDLSPGRHYAVCPNCSSTRTSAHRTLKCLGVTIEPNDKAFWGCNHCGWTGPEKGAGKANGAGKPELTTYVYRDAIGVERFRKVRNLPGRKPRFWLEQPDGRGGWRKNTKGVDTKILYRADEVAKAVTEGRVILVAEGEKDCDNLWRLGFPATCNAHGASEFGKDPKWYAHHSAQLKGAEIVVFNDCDGSGYAHADATCRLSLGVAARVRRLDLKEHWPDIPKGGDVSDWLAQGHGREELAALIDSAPDYERGDQADTESGEARGDHEHAPPPSGADDYGARARQSDRPRKFKLVPFEDIKFVAAEEWLVKKLLPQQGVAPIFGPSQTFKSFIIADLGLHVALGWEWAGRRTKQGPVVYIAAENARGTRKRKAGFELAHADRLPHRVPFYLIEAAPNLGTERNDRDALIASIEAVGVSPALIVVDTLAQTLAGGEENSSGMMTFLGNATAIANHFKCCAVPVHHAPLADEKRMRGHSSLYAGVDALLRAERKGNELGTTLSLDKLKDEEAGVGLIVRFVRIVIAHDEEGDEISTLVVNSIADGEEGAAAQAAKGQASKSIPKSLRLLMEVVEQAIEEAGRDLRSFANGPTVRAVDAEAVRRRYAARIAEQAGPEEDPKMVHERGRKAFLRAIETALKAKELMARAQGDTRFLWLP